MNAWILILLVIPEKNLHLGTYILILIEIADGKGMPNKDLSVDLLKKLIDDNFIVTKKIINAAIIYVIKDLYPKYYGIY